MSRKVYYGSFHHQRKRDNKKRFFILVGSIITIGAIVWLTIFFGAARRSDVGDVMKSSIQEITQLKLQLKEKEDEIILLKQQLDDYETELASRPTPTPDAIEPPNNTVIAGQQTPTPSPRPTTNTKKRTPTPTTQTPVQTPISVEPVPEAPTNNTVVQPPIENTNSAE